MEERRTRRAKPPIDLHHLLDLGRVLGVVLAKAWRALGRVGGGDRVEDYSLNLVLGDEWRVVSGLGGRGRSGKAHDGDLDADRLLDAFHDER